VSHPAPDPSRPNAPVRATATRHTPAASPARWALCVVLVMVPVVLALCVPLYQRTTPKLAGVPFFFWFQMLMAVAAAIACGTTYLLLFRHESEND